MSNQLMIDIDVATRKIVEVLKKTGRPFAFVGDLAVLAYGDTQMYCNIEVFIKVDPWERGFADTLADLLGDDFFSVSRYAVKRLMSKQCFKPSKKRQCSKSIFTFPILYRVLLNGDETKKL